MQKLNINLVNLRIQHHASASGYDQLINHLHADVITTNKDLTIFQRALARACRSKINRSNSLWYQRANFITEVNAACKWLANNNQIFHFLYGENSYRYLGNLKLFQKSNYIISTYHTPPTRFREAITNYDFLKALDAVIVVSTVQLEFFASMIGPERVFYVPHGIDVNYYLPQKKLTEKSGVSCISVGSHLRDFQTLAAVARKLKAKNLRFVVVAPEEYHHYFNGIRNVELHSAINDNDLLRLYQSADFMLLPLLDCTANNALLEGMSCGLPVVTTDLLGVKDYVNDECSILTPIGDSETLADAVSSLLENEEKLNELSKNSRARALEFQWPNVAQKIQDVYKHVANF